MGNDSFETIKSKYPKMPRVRELVIKALSCFNHYMTAEELWLFLRRNHEKLSIAAVYISLKWMEKEGIIRLKSDKDKKRKYIFKGKANTSTGS